MENRQRGPPKNAQIADITPPGKDVYKIIKKGAAEKGEKSMKNAWKERTESQQKKAISAEIKRLAALFDGLEGKKKEVADGLIEEAAFMRVQLEELKAKLLKYGFLDEMPQGKYTITRESPYSRAYNSMIQRYTTALGKLAELLPKEVAAEVDDGFDDFLETR